MDNWVRVAAAINQRVAELGLRQRELVERSHVSKAIVREIRHNTVQRRRSARTLEALSLALGWHPQHLSNVLSGHEPPEVADSTDDMPMRLTMIEDHLREIRDQLTEMNTTLSDLVTAISHAGRTSE